MTGPVPDPERGTLDSGQTIDQHDALAGYLMTHRAAFTLQYVPNMKHWTGIMVNYEGGDSIAVVGRYPTEVIYRLLKEAT
jgi:hypothetical protein